MNFLERLRAALISKAVTSSEKWQRSTAFVVSGGGGNEGKRQTFSPYSAVANYRSWIYAAANLNAIAVASTPLRLYVRNRSTGVKLWNTRKTSRRVKAFIAGDLEQRPSNYVVRKAAEYGSDFEEVTDTHPLLDLLSKVNPYQNGYDATVLRILYTELTGNAYLHPVLDPATKQPVELWTMPSQFVEIVPGKETFVEAYLYGASREQRKIFAPDEVIHFKRPNPADLYYGIGKVEAAWGAVQMNAAVHEMDLSFFENKARPDYLMSIKGDASPDEIERLEAQIDEKLRGARRTGRFLTSTADIDIKPLSFPPKELGGRTDIVEEIAAIFGVPVSMLRANDPNLASAQTGYSMWRESTVLPMLRMDEETLNQSLLPLFGIEGDAFLSYDNPVVEDRRLELEERRTAVSGGWMTINEARLEEGREPIDDPFADRALVNGQPLGGPAAAPPALPAPTDIQTEKAPDGLLGPLDIAPDVEDPQTQPLERKDALSECVAGKIPTLLDEGYPEDQAVAIAYSMCREGKSIEVSQKALGDIDTVPPKTVAENARRALEVRASKPESQRGMTAVGIARARDLANRKPLSEDTIRRMVAYFERHASDKQGSTWDDQGRGWQAWYGWGGDDGFAWASRKVDEFDRERERLAERKAKSSSGLLEKNGGGDPPAKPSERISGSDRNPEGSASGSRGGIEISEATEEALRAKVEEHNEKHGDEKGKRVDLGMLKAVYRRGAGAFSTSHRTGVGREQWSMARVNAFLALVRLGKPKDADYTTDFDLLPSDHPKSTKSAGCDCGSCGSKSISALSLWSKHLDEMPEPYVPAAILRKASKDDAERELDRIRKDEDKIAASVDRVFRRQVDAVLKELRESEVPTSELTAKVENILRSSKWDRELVAAMRPYLSTAISQGISVGVDAVKELAKASPDFWPSRRELEAYTEAESVRLSRGAARGVNRYTIERFSDIIGTGVQDGKTIPEIASDVQEWAGEKGDAARATRSRALMIARTETQRASRKAEVEAWKATGIVEGKTWLLAPDPCEFCEAASDAFSQNAVALEDSFFQKGTELLGADGEKTLVLDYESIDGPPLHPNCRCSLQPRLVSDYQEVIDSGLEEVAKLGPFVEPEEETEEA